MIFKLSKANVVSSETSPVPVTFTISLPAPVSILNDSPIASTASPSKSTVIVSLPAPVTPCSFPSIFSNKVTFPPPVAVKVSIFFAAVT